jgi:phage baseplate assembly protein W
MPVQRQSKQFKDILPSFQVSPLTYDLLALKNEYAIARSVKNLVLTNPGERFFNPELGSRVNSLLFEPLDEIIASEVRDEIEYVINTFEPRVDLQEVTALPDFNNGELNVTIQYNIVGIEAHTQQQLTFALQPTR